jgi:hypothetical protein
MVIMGVLSTLKDGSGYGVTPRFIGALVLVAYSPGISDP